MDAEKCIHLDFDGEGYLGESENGSHSLQDLDKKNSGIRSRQQSVPWSRFKRSSLPLALDPSKIDSPILCESWKCPLPMSDPQGS